MISPAPPPIYTSIGHQGSEVFTRAPDFPDRPCPVVDKENAGNRNKPWEVSGSPAKYPLPFKTSSQTFFRNRNGRVLKRVRGSWAGR